MAGLLGPTPPSLELNGCWNGGTLEKKDKKSNFSLMARPFTLPPLLIARPLREELFFSFLRLPLGEQSKRYLHS